MQEKKKIEKFDGLGPRRCEDTKEIVAPEIDPKSFGTSLCCRNNSFTIDQQSLWTSLE